MATRLEFGTSECPCQYYGLIMDKLSLSALAAKISTIFGMRFTSTWKECVPVKAKYEWRVDKSSSVVTQAP